MNSTHHIPKSRREFNQLYTFCTQLLSLIFLLTSGISFGKTASKPVLPVTFNAPKFPQEILDRLEKKESKLVGNPKIDPQLSQDWGLVNIGVFEAFTPFFQPMRANLETCSREVVIAVVDTGIDYTHPDLIGSLWVNSKEIPNNGIDDDNNGYVDDVVGWDFVHNSPYPYDTHGHGTHIAGIISAGAANGIGISGVCPSASIMPLRYYDSGDLGFNNLNNTVKAIRYAVQMGAQIINYSGGGAEPAPAERAAIEEAERKGVLVVAAAGNDSHDNDQIKYFPQSYGLPNIIGVASVNQKNERLVSSNYGKSVDIAAPGLGILSTLPENKYGKMSGTSQATAYVTGAAGLLASQLTSRKIPFDYRKLKHWLNAGAKTLPGNKDKSIVISGLLSIPGSLKVQREELNTPKELAVKK